MVALVFLVSFVIAAAATVAHFATGEPARAFGALFVVFGMVGFLRALPRDQAGFTSASGAVSHPFEPAPAWARAVRWFAAVSTLAFECYMLGLAWKP